MEYHIEDVMAFESGRPDSLLVVIPKTVRRMLGVQKGAKFHVKVDQQGRIIYDPVKKVEAEETSE
jgi:antitoxin component of MazEF toxin-antitoxin module